MVHLVMIRKIMRIVQNMKMKMTGKTIDWAAGVCFHFSRQSHPIHLYTVSEHSFPKFMLNISLKLTNVRIALVLRSKTIVETDPVLREAESESDCLADRSAAMDDQKVIRKELTLSKRAFAERYFLLIFLEWCRSIVCTRMYTRWQIPTDSMLSFSWILLVRSWRHRKKYTRNINKRWSTGLCYQFNQTNERMSRTTKGWISQRA